MSIQEAIQLNNHAVSWLKKKSFNNAVMRSCGALEMFQPFQHDVGAQVSMEQDCIDRFMLTARHSSDNTMMDEFIYDHGIVLPVDTTDSNIIIPVLIFNCALSHQLLAYHTTNDVASHQLLQRAERLYQLAFHEIDQDSRNVLFTFALVNNCGVLHKRLGNFEESNSLFEQLVSLMMVYIDIGGADASHLQPMNGLWTNVLRSGSLAPAA